MDKPFEIKIDSATAGQIRMMFGLIEGDKIEVCLRPLAQRIAELQMLLGPVSNGMHLTPSELAMLAVNTPHIMAEKHSSWLEPGVKVKSELQGSAVGTFQRVGPCGWAVCEFNGRTCIESPERLKLAEAPKPAEPVEAKPEVTPAAPEAPVEEKKITKAGKAKAAA